MYGHRSRQVPASGLVALVVVVAAVAVAALTRTTVWPTPVAGAVAPAPRRTAVERGSVTTLSLPAPDAPGGVRSVWVYRPGVPDSSDLPVVYFLHGLPGTRNDLASIGIVAQLDNAFTTGRLAPFVVVAPDGTSTGAQDPEWADSTNGQVLLEWFVTDELIQAVEGTHRRDARHRAIVGFSMGGYGAMNLALRHPDLYGQVVSLAGYFHLDDESQLFTTAANRAANTPSLHVASARHLRVMLADGMQDDDPVTAGETQRFAAELRQAGDHPVVDLPPGAHSLSFVSAELPRVESFLETGWAT